MNRLTIFILFFSITFLLIFLAHYFIVTKPALKKIYKGENNQKKGKAKKKKKEVEVGELNYLVYKFKLDKNKLNWKSLAIMIPLINAFIMSLVVSILELIPLNLIFKVLIAFVLLFSLIYSLYEIYGRYLKNKQEKERD